MPKYPPTFLLSDCWSSIGNITFYHRSGKCYWRRKPAPSFPGTPAQLQQSSVHHRAIMAWQQLDSAEQRQWREYAASVPAHRPPYRKDNHISGYNLFVSAYHGFAQLGNEHVPTPQPYSQFPSMSLEIVGSSVVDGTDLELTGRLMLSDVQTPERWQLLARIQLTAPGGGYDSGKLRSVEVQMKNATVTETYSGIDVEIDIPDYKSLWNVQQDTATVYMRFQLLDRITGYRNMMCKSKYEI